MNWLSTIRALLISLALTCAARAEIHVVGSGSIMMPTWPHGARLVIWEDDILTVHPGDLIARQLGPHLIGTRAVWRVVDGWVTRADGAEQDDAYVMGDSDYRGKVYPDSGIRVLGARPFVTPPITRDLYVLTPYDLPIRAREGDWATIPPVTSHPHSVPDGAPTSILLMVSLLGLGAIRRHFGA